MYNYEINVDFFIIFIKMLEKKGLGIMESRNEETSNCMKHFIDLRLFEVVLFEISQLYF